MFKFKVDFKISNKYHIILIIDFYNLIQTLIYAINNKISSRTITPTKQVQFRTLQYHFTLI